MSGSLGGGARDGWRLGAMAGAVVAVVIGLIGLAMAPVRLGLSDRIYGVLQLFVLTDDRIGSPPYNGLLDAARFLAPATTAYAVFETLRALLSGELRRRSLARRREHTIVCGDDATAVLLARALGLGGGPRPVLVGAATALAEREATFDAVRGDPRDTATLRAAGVAGASRLYACAAAPDTNTAVVLAAAERRSRPGRRFHAYAEVGNDELVEVLRIRQLTITQTPGTAIDFFALDETAARAVIADSSVAATDPVTIVGNGTFAVALLRALARLPSTDGNRRAVTVHTDTPDTAAETATWLGVTGHGVDLTIRGLGDPIAEPAGQIFVCQPGEDITIGLAIRLLRTPGRHITACLRQAAPFTTALGQTPGLRVIGVLDEACHPDRIADDAIIGRAARAIHDRYVAERTAVGDSAAVNPSMAPWGDLSGYLQESNYAQAEHIGAKLHAIDAVLSTTRPATPFAYRPGEVDLLARLEHKRWMDERRAAGFTWGPHRTDDHHPDLVDWPDLSSESRQKDVDVVTYLPTLLGNAGLFITRTT